MVTCALTLHDWQFIPILQTRNAAQRVPDVQLNLQTRVLPDRSSGAALWFCLGKDCSHGKYIEKDSHHRNSMLIKGPIQGFHGVPLCD